MQIVMPKLGLTMTEGNLTQWRKAEGDEVKQGEILFEFESEKSVLEFECPADGTLSRQLVAEGQTVPCGTPVAVLETTQVQGGRDAGVQGGKGAGVHGSNLPQPADQAVELPGATSRQSPGLQAPISATPAAKRRARELGVDLSVINGRGPQGRIHLADVEATARSATAALAREAITPMAKRLASDLNVDLAQISGSGPGGRVIKADVLRATLAQPEAVTQQAKPANTQPLTGVRGVIAHRMSESAFTAPHVTLFAEADASALVQARNQLNAELAQRVQPVKLSYNALLIAIVARSLRDHPKLNACIVDDEIHYYADVNVALAVDTERGLLVPVIRNADQLDLVTIQQCGDDLIQRALAGKSLPDDLTGGTITITNLGMFDIDGFTPIINQPQAAILGVGRIVSRPVVGAGDEIVAREMVTLSLSFDHRIVDGGPAARFLQRVRQLVERPFGLMIPL
jgi:pyruvate dehydrogenase E2 component (dihydrolipoamide acetyltransferase)